MAHHVAQEIETMGADDTDVTDTTVLCNATTVLPTITRYYGRRPEPRILELR